jgi:hypothetical protein
MLIVLLEITMKCPDLAES